MSAETAVMPKPPAARPEGRRRGRRSNDGRERAPLVHFYVAEPGSDPSVLVLKEKFEDEGHAVVASLTRGKPYYRVEIWQSRAVVKDGDVTVEKQAVRDEVESPTRTSSEKPID